MDGTAFVRLLFRSFFRWWWAAITGVASILGIVVVPDQFAITRGQFVVLLFLTLTLVFFCLSTIYQGWLMYTGRFVAPQLLRFQEMKEPGSNLMCLLDKIPRGADGKLAQLKRNMNGVEVPFAVIRFGQRNNLGQVHAEMIFISPIHAKDLQASQFGVNDIVVDLFMDSDGALQWAKSAIEDKTGARL